MKTNKDDDNSPEKPESCQNGLTAQQRIFTIILFILGLVVYFIVNFQRVSIPGQIFSQLQTDLQMSASAIAGMGAFFMYAYAVMQLLVGLLVDRYGGMRVISFGTVVMAAGTVIFATASSSGILIFGRVLVGIGCGCAYLSLIKECARLFPRYFTFMLGFIVFFGYSGGIVGTLPFVWSVNRFGWRNSMLAVGIVIAAITVAIAFLWNRSKQPVVNRQVTISGRTYLYEISNINLVKAVFSTMTGFGIYYAILTVMGKKFLEDVGGLSASHASLCCTLMVLLSAVINQITGLLGMKQGSRRTSFIHWQTGVVPLACILLLAAILIAPGHSFTGWFLAGTFMLIMMTSAFSPIVNVFLTELVDPSMTALAVGLGNFAAYLFVALFGSLSGLILDLFRSSATVSANGAILYPVKAYIALFMIFFLLSAMAFIVSFFLPETYGRNIHNGKPHPLRLRGRVLFTMHT